MDQDILKEKHEQEILLKLLAKKEKNKSLVESIRKGSAVIGKNEINFDKKSFFTNFLSLMMPTIFVEKEADKDHYLYNNLDHDIHIIISLFNKGAKELELKNYKAQVAKNMMQDAKASINWIEEGIYMQGGQRVTYFAFTCPVEEEFVYNFIFFTTKGEQTVIINFNCMENQFENWEMVGKAIMQTMEVN